MLTSGNLFDTIKKKGIFPERTKGMKALVLPAQGEITKSDNFNTDFFNKWLAYLDTTPNTANTYKKAVKQFVLWLTEKGIVNPSREDVISYREELRQTRKPTTVQLYIEAVRLFFKWLEQERLYPNVADHVKGAKIDKEHKKDPLTSKQATALLDSVERTSARGKRDYAILALMLTTGLRTVSIVNADVGDIRTVGDDVVLFYKGKGHDEKNTYVKLAEPVEKAVRDYLNSRGATTEKEPLFSSESNRNTKGRMTTRSISRLVKDHLCGVGLKSERLTAHSLRHTAATLNLLQGGNIEETQQLLNHSNINTTMIYVHALERAKNQSESRIAGAIFK